MRVSRRLHKVAQRIHIKWNDKSANLLRINFLFDIELYRSAGQEAELAETCKQSEAGASLPHVQLQLETQPRDQLKWG